MCLFAVSLALGAWRAEVGGWLTVFADAATLTAAFMLSYAALMLAARGGLFDIITYGSKRLLALVWPPLGNYRESYYDYKAHRRHRRAWLLPPVISGAAFLTAAIILSIYASG